MQKDLAVDLWHGLCVFTEIAYKTHKIHNSTENSSIAVLFQWLLTGSHTPFEKDVLYEWMCSACNKPHEKYSHM